MATIDSNGLALQAGNTPSHIQSGDGDAFLLGSQLLADNPFLLNTYFKQTGRDMTTLQKISSFFKGRVNTTRAADSPYTGHWEKPRWNKNITVGAVGAGANPDEAVITLTAADMVTDAVAQSGITYVRSYPRKNDTIQAQAGGVQFWVIAKNEAVNPHTITVKSADGSDPADAFVPGAKVTVGPPTFGEGTDQPAPLTVRRYRYQNTFTIIKETDAVTGSHMTTTARFQPVPGSNLLFLEGLQDMEKRHQWGKGWKWMADDQVDAGAWQEFSPILQQNVAITGTQGLIPYIRQSGREFVYDPNDFGIDDLRALASYYHDINIGSSEVMLIQGYNVNQLIETSLADKLNYEWVIGVSDKYVSQSMRNNWAKGLNGEYNPNGAFINLGITGFALGQFTFLQTAAPEFNDMQGPGAIGYKDWMIATPWGYADVENDKIPYLGYEVRGVPGYRREDEIWVESGAGSRAITGRSDFLKTMQSDGTRFFERTEMAAHFALGEQFALFTPGSASS